MIRPILATADPYAAAQDFVKAGWTLDFSNPAQDGDPLTGVSLYDNHLLLGTMEERYVSKLSVPYIGAGVVLYIMVPWEALDGVYAGHANFFPTELSLMPWGDRAFEVSIQGYRLMIAAALI